MNFRCLLVLLPVAGAVPAAAQSVVVAQSEIAFVSRQLGVPVEGSFKQWSAQFAFDPKKPESGRVSFSIDTGSATIGTAEVDAELPRAAWFNAAQFPQATFQSSAIRPASSGTYDVAGQLTIKGSVRNVVVPVTLVQNGIHGTATGSFTIRRLDFRVGEGEWADTSMLANDVLVRFKLALTNLPPM